MAVLEAIKKQQLERFPLYEEATALAEEITSSGVDLNLISEFNIKVFTQYTNQVKGTSLRWALNRKIWSLKILQIIILW